MSQSGKPIVREIRRRLMLLCNMRERAYREARKSGFIITKYKLKTEAIEMIRAQLEASGEWSLDSHIKMVNGLADKIEMILPHVTSRYHDFRKGIVDLLTWCYNQQYKSSHTLTRAA